MATQTELASQMLAQLRLLDPSVSAEIGTPERKILDTVAQALSDVQIDLTQLSGALDVDSKVGANLDRFLALFGFGRQQATKATGFAQFSREEPSTTDIPIPAGTQIAATGSSSDAPNAPADETQLVIFETTFQGILLAGETSIQLPIRALLPGVLGNVAENKVVQFVSNVVWGISTVTNPAPTTGGSNAEDDDSLKIRFKNTVFRNLAGTQDQYIALAVSAAFTKKVNVVGPLSRYREYIQVPPVDDASSYNVNPTGSTLEAGNGNANEYTTALSTIPYSKHIYETVPIFISNGQTGVSAVFWRQDIDWRFNTSSTAKNRGDAYRFFHSDITPQIGLDATSQPFQPNVTFINVYTGSNDEVTAVRPNDTLLLEHAYLSTASRNDYDHNVTNCVDVFIDGSNDTVASTILPAPGVSTTQALTAAGTSSKYTIDNYRLWGKPDTKPTVGHLYFPLFWQPVVDLPASISISSGVDTSVFFRDEHYFLVEDITDLHGTVRARNGLAWNATAQGANGISDPGRTGLALNGFPAGTSVLIENYFYDKNIIDLQNNLEAAKQTTTDVLVHRSRERWFKLDITVMYSAGANAGSVNTNIRMAVDNFLQSQYFGNAIQLSDILQVIHSVPGVDNVRWSSDIPGNTDLSRVQETDSFGVARPPVNTPPATTLGSNINSSVTTMTVASAAAFPASGNYKITIDNEILLVTGGQSTTTWTVARAQDGSVAAAHTSPVAVTQYLPRYFNADFFIQDDELPRLATAVPTLDANQVAARVFSTQPGLIIRARAQNTWTRA